MNDYDDAELIRLAREGTIVSDTVASSSHEATNDDIETTLEYIAEKVLVSLNKPCSEEDKDVLKKFIRNKFVVALYAVPDKKQIADGIADLIIKASKLKITVELTP